MTTSLEAIYLARHAETEWSLTGQHTGLTDLPLTPRGEEHARLLGRRLQTLSFDAVFTSPLQRARRTCELAGYGPQAVVDEDLVEWDYGAYEGLRTADIRRQKPDWQLFWDGCLAGESVEAIGARADRVLARLRGARGRVLVFSSGHFSRVLAARWLDLPPSGGRLLVLSTASLSILGYEHNHSEPVIKLWNDEDHLRS